MAPSTVKFSSTHFLSNVYILMFNCISMAKMGDQPKKVAGVLSLILLFSLVLVLTLTHSVNASSSNQITFAKPPVINLVSTPDPSLYGQSVTFKATSTSGIPDGETISFVQGSTVLGTGTTKSGTATFTINTLAAASYTVYAAYAGDASFPAANSSSVLQTIRRAATTTSLISNATVTVSGQAVLLTATVKSPGVQIPNGDSVNFFDGSNIIGAGKTSSGVAAFTVNSFSPGVHPITATYIGDANFTGSSNSLLTEKVSTPITTTATTTVPPTACQIALNVSSGSVYYVAPQKIVIYYTVKDTVPCGALSAVGTLSLSGATDGDVYSSIPINISSIFTTPVTRVVYANSTEAPKGQNIASLTLLAGSTSVVNATSFYILQPANITIKSMNIVPNVTQIGSQVSIISDLFNNAFFDAGNATMNIKIVYPNLSVSKIRQFIGRIPAFENTSIIINPGISGISQQPGNYLFLENVSFYSNYSTPHTVYTSFTLYTNTSAASYTAYTNPTSGYLPSAGYPAPAAGIGPLKITSFPYYTSLLSGTSTNLSKFVVYSANTYQLNVTVPSLKFGKLIASTNSLPIVPNQSEAIQFSFTPTSNIPAGTYIIPVNVSLVSLSSNITKTQLNMIVNIYNRSVLPQVLSSVNLLNGNKNASVSLNIFNPTNAIDYNLLLSTKLNFSISTSRNSITVSGQGANISTNATSYKMRWALNQLAANSTAQLGYLVTNITQPRALLFPSTLLASTRQANFTSLIVLGIKKPQITYTNSTVNITVSTIYAGSNITTINITLIPPPGATVLNSHETFKAVPNSAIDAVFVINTWTNPGNETFKLITPGRFAPQTQYITLNVVAKPGFTIVDYLSDPRTIFGAATLVIYIVMLVYRNVIKGYRARKAKNAETEIKNVDSIRKLDKKIGKAIIVEGTVKRTFQRHINKNNLLGGFVETSAIAGEGVIIASTAIVENDAIVSGTVQVLENATISDNAVLRGSAVVSGNAKVGDNAELYGNAKAYGSAKLFGDCEVYDHAAVYGEAEVFGDAVVYGEAEISGNAKVYGDARISGDAKIKKGKIQKGNIVSGSR